MTQRIVSLEPSITATLAALGQRHRLVGVTRYCHRLAEVTGLPQLDTTWAVKADEVAALQPDLVIAATPYQAGKIDTLLQAKLDVLCLYPQSVADVYRHIRWLGRLCDAADQADTLVAQMQTGLADLIRRAKDKPRQRVYVEEWPKPLMTAGLWIAELVELLGGDCVPQPTGRQVTDQEVIEADPEVIILCWAGIEQMDPERVLARAGWSNVSAVRSGRVVAVNEILLNAPGPNLVEGAQQLWQALYPA
ncbi:MAG: ABC transporter substrate-binding protein [Anaerolineae bacterium]|nr:ABC transporter substrate-binding protein [Anaerolineae bacterium]